MKSKKIIALASLFLLAGCAKDNAATEVSSSTAASETVASTMSTESSEEVVINYDNEQLADLLTELAVVYPDSRFPSEVPYEAGKNLNVVANVEEQNEALLYYALDEKYDVNADNLHAETPFAAFYKEVLESPEAAQEMVGKQIAAGASEVDLGHGITGYREGGAGSAYLVWEEGNWVISVRASNIDGQDPVVKGQEIVEFLETVALPAPNTDGQINIDLVISDMYATQIRWQAENVVYTVCHQDAISAIKMAVSMNN
ncbi:hypothetical protein M2139_002790 [Enterococcus sp. PF1-24]|uniref:hypothetical protein n=1 Tax=unclassified Enterococcus TaxID=2608891 RepID=UPI0024755DBD|nr:MULTISPECIES: hypothetical protein [unclassified Enterococcus]MDH6365757.1 hypothetical protein [Enterococcus sp. PFB1-1]MDH6402860.1 hypothetical protein [Enterococcus sp. PF1-24]